MAAVAGLTYGAAQTWQVAKEMSAGTASAGDVVVGIVGLMIGILCGLVVGRAMYLTRRAAQSKEGTWRQQN